MLQDQKLKGTMSKFWYFDFFSICSTNIYHFFIFKLYLRKGANQQNWTEFSTLISLHYAQCIIKRTWILHIQYLSIKGPVLNLRRYFSSVSIILYTNERRYRELKRRSLVYTTIVTEEKYCLYFGNGAFIDKHFRCRINWSRDYTYCLTLSVLYNLF